MIIKRCSEIFNVGDDVIAFSMIRGIADELEDITFSIKFPAGLGNTGGFEFVLQSTAGDTPQNMAAVFGGLAVAANQRPELGSVFSTFKASVPQIFLDIDREKAKTLGQAVNNALTYGLGLMVGFFVNGYVYEITGSFTLFLMSGLIALAGGLLFKSQQLAIGRG